LDLFSIMIKIFDLGSYTLIPLEEFLIYKEYKNEEIQVFSYEPDIDQHTYYKNNLLIEYFKSEYPNLFLTISKDAIYTKPGQIDYVEVLPIKNWKYDPLDGSEWTVSTDTNNRSFISSPAIKTIVNTVDINIILENNIKETDFVIIRMDIEGCEFNVLSRILENDKLCEMIDEIYLEWHDFFWEKGDVWWKSIGVNSILPSEMILDKDNYSNTHWIDYDLRQSLKKLFFKQFQQYNIELKDLSEIDICFNKNKFEIDTGFGVDDKDIRKEIIDRRSRFLEKTSR